MDISPWIPCGLAYFATFICFPILAWMPKYKIPSKPTAPQETDHEPSLEPKARSFKQALANRNVLLALPVFFVGSIRYSVLNVLMQYASVRFGFLISRTALFYTENAVANTILFLFIVPRLTMFLRGKYSLAPQVVDLKFVRISLCLLSFGALCLALSPSGNALLYSKLSSKLNLPAQIVKLTAQSGDYLCFRVW